MNSKNKMPFPGDKFMENDYGSITSAAHVFSAIGKLIQSSAHDVVQRKLNASILWQCVSRFQRSSGYLNNAQIEDLWLGCYGCFCGVDLRRIRRRRRSGHRDGQFHGLAM